MVPWTALTQSSRISSSLNRKTTGSPTFFNSSSFSTYITLVASKVSYSQSSAFVSSDSNFSRSEELMKAPYLPLSLILSRMVRMYDSRSFRFSSVSMISFMSACMAVSSSCCFCSVLSGRPHTSVATTLMSVRFVRFFFLTTSTHSTFFSGSFLGDASFASSPSAFSPSGFSASSAGFSSLVSAGTSISFFSLIFSSYSSSSSICALSMQ
mmetsp:Transcript_76217/g.182357  ORF Transcript_76217/g.182357 Transcript_76217/m.182357 type:complete len:210 (-) Transcript_76217:1567-2196(-)